MPSRSWGSFLLFVAPLSAVLMVVLGVVSGGARPVRSARVYGGSTQGVTELSLRVELGERDRVVEVPVPDAALRVVAIEGGQRVATSEARTDALGMAEVVLKLPRPRDSAFELWVEPASQVEPALAKGLVLGDRARFQAAGRRGGFQSGRRSGELELSVAPAHGVLITTQGALTDELVIRAQHAASPVDGARLKLELDGAEPAQQELTTDRQGLVRCQLRPRNSRVHVKIEAVAEGVGTGKLALELAVVQGAIRATRQGQRLLLESSGAANLAFVGIFDQQRRYGGLQVPLLLAADGRLLGEAPWPAGLPDVPLWVVTSSQPDLASPSAVGWPMSEELSPQTFDARELLLLDGSRVASAREERRVRRIRFVTAGYAALALALTLWLFVRRVREAEARIERHLTRSGIDDAARSLAPAGKGRTLLAAACIGLGFLVLVLVALLKD